MLCRLALCIVSPSEANVKAYEAACSPLLGNTDAMTWGRSPRVDLLPRLAVRLYPQHEVRYKNYLNYTSMMNAKFVCACVSMCARLFVCLFFTTSPLKRCGWIEMKHSNHKIPFFLSRKFHGNLQFLMGLVKNGILRRNLAIVTYNTCPIAFHLWMVVSKKQSVHV